MTPTQSERFRESLEWLPAIARRLLPKLAMAMAHIGWDRDDLDSAIRVGLWRASVLYRDDLDCSWRVYAHSKAGRDAIDQARGAGMPRPGRAGRLVPTVSLDEVAEDRSYSCRDAGTASKPWRMDQALSREPAPHTRLAHDDEVARLLRGLLPGERHVLTVLSEGGTQAEAARQLGLCETRASRMLTDLREFAAWREECRAS